MIDPLTALGVVGNCVQLIDFSFNLLSEGTQIYHASNGVTEDRKVAADLVEDLSKLTQGLSESQNAWIEGHGDVELDPDEIRLRNVCDRCLEIAVEFKLHLQKLRIEDGARLRRLKSYKQALISVWRKDQLDAIESRLQRYQKEIDTHVIFGLRKSAREADVKQSAQFDKLDQRTKALTLAVLDNSKDVEGKLSSQADVLASIHENTNLILQQRRTPPPLPTYEAVVGATDVYAAPLHGTAAAGDVLKLRQLLRSSTLDVNVRDKHGCTALHVVSSGDAARRLLADRRTDKSLEDYEGRTALHCAVLKRRLDVIKVLLEHGVEKNLKDDRDNDALFYAKSCRAATWMLTYGDEIEARAPDHLNNTGLFQMAWLGDVEGVEFYLRHKADVNAINDWHETALTESARHGDARIVELLVQNGANLEIGSPVRDEGPKEGRAEVVRILLKSGADKNARLKKGGNNAVAQACSHPQFDIARLLIEAGTNIESLDYRGWTPLIAAAAFGDDTFAHWLLQRGADKEAKTNNNETAVFLAARNGHIETLRVLLEHKAIANYRGPDGYTPISTSAQRGQWECVHALLDHDADPDMPGAFGSGYTALCEASHHNQVDVVKLLLKRGANPAKGSNSGFSSLSVAASRGHVEVLRVLAEHGADIEQPGYFHKNQDLSITPLMRSVSEGHGACIKPLAGLGAKLDAQTASGKTALHIAVDNYQPHCVAALIEEGADVNVQDINLDTAAMIAAYRGFKDITKMLVDAGANLSLRDKRGRNAWIVAVHNGQEAKLEPLLKPNNDEEDSLRRMQAECHPSEIAAYLSNER